MVLCLLYRSLLHQLLEVLLRVLYPMESLNFEQIYPDSPHLNHEIRQEHVNFHINEMSLFFLQHKEKMVSKQSI